MNTVKCLICCHLQLGVFLSEILHRFRHPGQAYGAVRASGDDRNPVPHLEAGDVAALRKLHHVAHPHEHYSAHAQGEMSHSSSQFKTK